MVNYGNSMIYKLCCKDTNITDIYIGSTTNFYRRKSQHKSCSKSYNNYKYQFIRDNGGFENWDMVLIKNVNVSNKRELEQVEREYIDELKPILNSNMSYTSQEEKKEQKIEWYNNNKEAHKISRDKYTENNTQKVKEYHKNYYEDNKEHLVNYHNEWKKKNKEELKKKASEKINCAICNSLISKRNISRHQQTKKCISCKN